jgi:tRNA A-37 threonylcarbamoyl transferase component Bud32
MPVSVLTGAPGVSTAEALVRVRSGGASWVCTSGAEDLVTGEHAPPWFDLSGCPTARGLKSGRARHVWMVAVGGREVVAKVYAARTWSDRVKRRVLGTQAQREWSVLQRAAERGVPVVRPLAVGSDGSGSSVLLMEPIPVARTLAELWNEPSLERDPAWRRSVIAETARLVAEAHGRGFAHRDLHPGNMLVGRTADGNRVFALADALGARVGRGPVRRAAELRGLGQLAQFFRRRATRTDHVRFLKEYLHIRGSYEARTGSAGLPPAARECVRSWWPHLIRAFERQRAALVRRRDRRLHGDGKYFARMRLGGGWRAIVCLRFGRGTPAVVAPVDPPVVGEWKRRLIEIARSMARSEESVEARRARDWRERLAWTLAGSPHRREFLHCHQCLHRGLTAPLVRACIEHRAWGLIDVCCLVHADAPLGECPAESASPAQAPGVLAGRRP